MLFLESLTFVLILIFIICYNVLRSATSYDALLKFVLLGGSFVIISMVIDVKSIGVLTGLSILVFFFAQAFHRFPQIKSLFPWFLALIVGLFILRNYQIRGVELLQRLGLSYILFRFIHFLVESKRHQIKRYDVITFLNYIFFFPTFLAGPIDQYNNFNYWVGHDKQSMRRHLLKAGIFRICLGAFKKYFIVSQLFIYAADFSQYPQGIPWQAQFLLSLITYSFYILFDFSGYSDIAIGSAYLIGIRTPENFNWPYFSRNISVFWKRWHITFSRFLFLYVFKPVVTGLSDSYRKAPRLFITCLGYIITFVICGMWHGNTLNFIYWGLWHAVGLIIYKCWDVYGGRSRLAKLNSSVFVAITFLFVTAGWFFFNYSTNSISLIASNFFTVAPNRFAIETISYKDQHGFKLVFNPPHEQDSLIAIEFKRSGDNFFKKFYYRREQDNTYFVIPESQKKELYVLRIKSFTENSPGSDWLSQVAYLTPQKNTPLFFQKILFGATSENQRVEVPDRFVNNSFKIPVEFIFQRVTARPLFFDGYGWGIEMRYMPNPIYKVEIWIKHDEETVWTLSHDNRPGRYEFAHIHGNISAGNVNRNLKSGKYNLRLRYVDNDKRSFWFESSVLIPNYSE
jgi:D-alanyl-lipoteichoic acid acyltransferase DltB (MBOAT superfamily)